LDVACLSESAVAKVAARGELGTLEGHWAIQGQLHVHGAVAKRVQQNFSTNLQRQARK
jgi:hypothetical protein